MGSMLILLGRSIEKQFEFLGVKTYTRSSRNRYELDYSGLGSLATKNTCLYTRLAPAGCKWRYTHKNDYTWPYKIGCNPTEWPCKWVIWVMILLLSGFVTQFEIRRGPPCRLQYVPAKCFLRYTITPSSEQKTLKVRVGSPRNCFINFNSIGGSFKYFLFSPLPWEMIPFH